MTKHLYLRCMDGHWFREHTAGWACPLDGWFFGEDVRAVLGRLDDVTELEDLRRAGVPKAAVDGAMLVEFGTVVDPPLLLEPTLRQ
jgi:hypothetical protein